MMKDERVQDTNLKQKPEYVFIKLNCGTSFVDVRCPQAIVDYNHHMGGIDLGDSTGTTIRYNEIPQVL